jgi:hypothetical protein
VKAHLKYLSYVLRHKWFVLRAGLELGVPLWQLLVHDWSKFLPSEWFPYVDYFYGERPRSTDRFNQAWLSHQRRNPHHWQYWVLLNDDPKPRWLVQAHQPEVGPYTLFDSRRDIQVASFGIPAYNPNRMDETSDELYAASVDVERALLIGGGVLAMRMPDRFQREMLADWRGAGRAQGKPNTLAWYRANREKMILHPLTRTWVEQQLGYTANA